MRTDEVVYDVEVMVCERCEHRMERCVAYQKRNGATCWKTEYGCALINLKPIRARWVKPGRNPKEICPMFSWDPEDISYE